MDCKCTYCKRNYWFGGVVISMADGLAWLDSWTNRALSLLIRDFLRFMPSCYNIIGGFQVKLCGFIQYFNLVGAGIGYTIATSISMIAIKRSNCFQKKGHDNPFYFDYPPLHTPSVGHLSCHHPLLPSSVYQVLITILMLLLYDTFRGNSAERKLSNEYDPNFEMPGDSKSQMSRFREIQTLLQTLRLRTFLLLDTLHMLMTTTMIYIQLWFPNIQAICETR
nr:amino acid permease 3 [Tanacetum cinerariifolium]